ncbi:unnamed protein product, partial [marine sediment metagenome]
MAIEISPKTRIKAPIWTIIVGAVLLILLIGFTVAYFYFVFYINKISQELEEKNITTVPLEKAITEKEAELEPISQKIDDFDRLFVQHKKTINTFTFLERICLPTVWFSSFGFDSDTGKINVSGQADSFAILEQQILVLEQELMVKNLDVSEVSMDEE